jgi:uncharacterized membrane protein YgdD (TMEM256/DUF423 family)
MQARTTLTLASVSGFLAVALGAFGAHGLKPLLSADLLQVYQTGVQYHLLHTVVLLALGIWQLVQPQRWLNRAAIMMLLGIVLFSGSLYLLAVTGIRILGVITPLGGVSWLAAWLMLAMAARAGIKTTSNTGIQSDR